MEDMVISKGFSGICSKDGTILELGFGIIFRQLSLLFYALDWLDEIRTCLMKKKITYFANNPLLLFPFFQALCNNLEFHLSGREQFSPSQEDHRL